MLWRCGIVGEMESGGVEVSWSSLWKQNVGEVLWTASPFPACLGVRLVDNVTPSFLNTILQLRLSLLINDCNRLHATLSSGERKMRLIE